MSLRLSCDQNIIQSKIEELRHRGILKHNTIVEETGKGVLITKRMPKINEGPDQYLPCDLCISYVKSSNLPRRQLRKKIPLRRFGKRTAGTAMPK